ncbi:hypothetical protein CGZ80_21885 [Rhodopirellula sp. MGV]|nr:hypothetical protein CGZ80_21885 [Rhodopirellula sp. MGV]PNY34625.1 hypothetical protein C2E31_21820 [Rhodopirellula baltica]
MRQFRLLKNTALAALVAGSFLAGHQVFADDFDALLAEVEFADPSTSGDEAAIAPVAPVEEAGAQSALGLELPPEPLPHEPAAAVDTLPAVPAPPTPVSTGADQLAPIPEPVPAPVASVAMGGSCQSCGGHSVAACGCNHGHHKLSNCLGNRIQAGSCMPYMPPQLPTSTFYQYWRSNACNANVWDGYQNRCHDKIDLSIHRNARGCNGCDNGCATVPANWCDLQESCE